MSQKIRKEAKPTLRRNFSRPTLTSAVRRHQLSRSPQPLPAKRFKSLSRRFFTPLNLHHQVRGITCVSWLPSNIYYSWRSQGPQRVYLCPLPRGYCHISISVSWLFLPPPSQTGDRLSLLRGTSEKMQAWRANEDGRAGGTRPPESHNHGEERRRGRLRERHIPGNRDGGMEGGSKAWGSGEQAEPAHGANRAPTNPGGSPAMKPRTTWVTRRSPNPASAQQVSGSLPGGWAGPGGGGGFVHSTPSSRLQPCLGRGRGAETQPPPAPSAGRPQRL